MKTNYTDSQLQAAIDEACIEIRREHRGKVGTSLVIDTAAMPSTYKAEASARLDLIKSALAALPEPVDEESMLLNLLAVIHRDGGHYQAEHGTRKAVEDACKEWQRLISIVEKTGLTEPKQSLSQLRPLAEAGEVPEGCVRYHFSKYGDDIGVGTIAKHLTDVLFADIRLPAPAEKPDPYAELKKAHAAGKVIQCKLDVVDDFWEDMKDPRRGAKPHEYRIKPEPEPLATKPILPPTWTPKVGDVVTLKSGGPKMTIRAFDRDDPMEAWCHWFKEEKSCAETFPTACLQPA